MMAMKNKILIFLAIGFISTASPAQELVLPGLTGYKIKTGYPVFLPENLWDFINGAADTYLAYGFVDLHVAEYKKGKGVIKLEIYKHTDNTMAFGIYSTERSPSFRFVNLGAQGYIADGTINFFKGSYYVKIKHIQKRKKYYSQQKHWHKKSAGCSLVMLQCHPHFLNFRQKGRKQMKRLILMKVYLDTAS
jgi:hypothetical protein